MAAVEQVIPNLLGGVSQQPDDVKLPGQVREAENVFLDPTFGCLKRPPTRWTANLGSDIPQDAKWFPIFRDSSELYMATIYRNELAGLVLRVFDAANGSEYTVNMTDEFAQYVDESELDNLKTLSIADYTLIANPDIRPGISKVEPEEAEDALVIVDAVSYNTTYNIDLSGEDAEPVTTTRASKLRIWPTTWNDSAPDQRYQAAVTFQLDYDTPPPADSDFDGLESIDNPETGVPPTGTGLTFRIVTQGTTYRESGTDDEYDTRYQTEVILFNGGEGWLVGDRLEVQMNGKDYNVIVEEVIESEVYASHGTASYTSPVDSQSGGLNLVDVTSGLVQAVNGIAGYDYEAETVDNVIRIKRTSNSPFGISTRGGQSGSNLSSLRKTAADISKLPSQCFDDYRLKIVNTEDTTADDYYVKFVSDQGEIPGAGSWIETVRNGDEEYLNADSMPFALVREADLTFTLSPLKPEHALGGWAGRAVGDTDSTPTPSFARGTTSIRGMFLHRNRLGFVTEDACVLSQPGDFFNFYGVSGVTISDADPIDISASDTKPVSLKDAISTSKGVVLLGEQAQFSLGTTEAIFSSNTAEMKKISGYDYLGKVAPQHTGVSVMYATSAGEFTKVMELAVESIQNKAMTEETSRAVPRYIPTDLDWSACSPNNDMVLYGKKDDGIYIFRFFNQGNERQVAGWTKWIFEGSIEFAAFKGDDLFLVERRGDVTHLLEMTLIDGPNSPINVDFTQYRPRVDFQRPSSALVDSELNDDGQRVYQIPAEYGLTGDVTIAYTDNSSGDYLETTIVDGVLTAPDRPFIVGEPYNAKLVLPKFWTRPNPDKPRADHVSPVMVQVVYIDMYNSGAIECEVDVRGYPARNFFMEISQADDYSADSTILQENKTYALPVYQRGDWTSITLSSLTPYPTSVLSYSWQGHYNKRGYRML